MLNSTVLEVAIGLLFCYGAMALIASSIYEAIASLFKLRARSLFEGVKSLLNDKELKGLALGVYNHALVNPRDGGKEPEGSAMAVKPSYIQPRAFAIAVLDTVGGASIPFELLKGRIDELPDGQIRSLLQGMYTRAEGKVENLQAALAGWFDVGMDRVSGAYKRQAQLFTFLIAFALAAFVNVDTFHLFATLWKHPGLAAKITAGAGSAQEALTQLDILPVGWTNDASFSAASLVGWLITALSVLFGAPFWFDLLQRLVNLRGTGGKPDDARAPKK